MVIQAAVGFSIGLLSLHYWSYVPATHELTIITLLGGGVALFLRYYLCHYALANVLIWALAGGLFVYISTSNYIYTVKQIPPMGANITIVGIVDSIQNVNIPSDNFDFIIKEWRGQPETSIREMKVRLYWDKANTLKQGEVLQLQAMLRRPYGRVNQAVTMPKNGTLGMAFTVEVIYFQYTCRVFCAAGNCFYQAKVL